MCAGDALWFGLSYFGGALGILRAVSTLGSSGGSSSSVEEEGAPHLVTSSFSPSFFGFQINCVFNFFHFRCNSI